MRVADVMSTDVVTISMNASLRDAAQLLMDRQISGLPVVDDEDHVVGVVSEADFLKIARHHGGLRRLVTRILTGGDVSDGYEPTSAVASVMSTPPRTISPDEPVSAAAARMGRAGINRLPVTVDGRLVGIVTRADVVRLYARSDDELRRDVQIALGAIDGVELADVHEGVAALRGSVQHQATAEAARMIAARVEGIVAVDTTDLSVRRDFTTE